MVGKDLTLRRSRKPHDVLGVDIDIGGLAAADPTSAAGAAAPCYAGRANLLPLVRTPGQEHCPHGRGLSQTAMVDYIGLDVLHGVVDREARR